MELINKFGELERELSDMVRKEMGKPAFDLPKISSEVAHILGYCSYCLGCFIKVHTKEEVLEFISFQLDFLNRLKEAK